jgi:hypothetical protein
MTEGVTYFCPRCERMLKPISLGLTCRYCGLEFNIWGEEISVISEKTPKYNQNNNRNEFKVNQYLTLRLERGITNIYVKGHLFNQCKYLLLNIPTSNVEYFDDIESIDEAEEILDRSMEGHGRHDHNINPRTEFWGHCSNMQTWVENDYDTRLLHRNLAFPLLKRLADAGDPKARIAFREEIARRLVSGYPSVVEFISQQGYLNYLGAEELATICEDPEFLKGIIKHYNYFVETSRYFDNFYMKAPKLLPNLLLAVLSNINSHKYAQSLINKIKNTPLAQRKQLMGVLIDRLEDGEFYVEISDIVNIFGVKFLLNNIPPRQLTKLLDHPNSPFNKLLIKYEGKPILIQNHENLDLRKKNISDLTKIEGLQNFQDVKKIILDDNNIIEIKGLEMLQNLEEISLKNNKITDMQGIEKLPNLININLENNQIKDIKGLKTLKNLCSVNLSSNSIFEINCAELPKVENLHLENNLIMKIRGRKNFAKKKVIVSFRVTKDVFVSLDGNDININIGNKSTITLRDHSIFIEKNGLLQQYTALDKVYPGFAEISPILKKTPSKKRSMVHISIVHPLGIGKSKDQIEERFRELCSILQIWSENEYDVRLIRKDLLFPIIEQLEDVKDSLAKRLSNEVKSVGHIMQEPDQLEDSIAIIEEPFFVAEEYFSEHHPRNSLRDTTLKRKLFSTSNSSLLSVLYFYDFHSAEIKFVNPKATPIREKTENFIHIFLKGALVKIKEDNPYLNLKYKFYKDSDIIEAIKISNLNSLHEFDLITEKTIELLALT